MNKSIPQSITVIGRVHYQKRTGNPYHTAQILVNGKTAHKTPRQYGGQNDYHETACRWLEENEIIPKRAKFENGSEECHWRHIRDNLKIVYEYMSIEVARERDL